jgi:hypothetical protein
MSSCCAIAASKSSHRVGLSGRFEEVKCKATPKGRLKVNGTS